MNPNQFQIPKQTDESLLTALGLIRDQLEGFAGVKGLFIRVNPHHNGQIIDIRHQEPASAPEIGYVISEHSEIMPTLYLTQQLGGPRNAIQIQRKSGEITDVVTVDWEWASQLSHPNPTQAFVKAMSLARKHLRAMDAEASLSRTTDSEWSRYRDAQQAILSSLEETAKSVLVESNRRILEAEAAAAARYADMERALTENFASKNLQLENEHASQMKLINDREEAMKQREQSFNTKEARYVTRQGQQTQIESITNWLNGWSLTKGTTNKWQMVAGVYGGAILLTLCLTFWFGNQNFQLLKSTDLLKVLWWQWVVLSLKSIIPLAAFTTFLVYFIRWSSVWARQHAEEEFRNRARLLDVGRSAWLLEAVRDAHDNKAKLPPELLKELSKNLFSYNVGSDASGLYPEAMSELLAQGLASFRIKSNGTEVEVKSAEKK